MGVAGQPKKDLIGPSRRFAAVVFDLFGTLTKDYLEADRLAIVRSMTVVLDAPFEEFLLRWDAGIPERLLGTIPLREDVAKVCAALGLAPTEQQVTEACEVRRRGQMPFFEISASVLSTLQLLRDHKGLPLALVSACTEEIPALFAASPLGPLFDVTIFSSQVHLMKPDPAIYLAASQGLGMSPHECLFIGDGAFGELHGAQEAGMSAALLRRPRAADAVDGDAVVHRPGEREWDGDVIQAIPEVLRLLC